MRPARPTFGDVLDLHVSLRDVEPAIWRRVSVPARLPLSALHDVLQICFGWTNSHLHEFVVDDVSFGMIDDEDGELIVDERGAPLGAVARVGATFLYRYDFGDDWEHDVRVERVKRAGGPITCAAGKRAGPPEDCGGPHGYSVLLEALADPKNPEHEELRRWAPRRFAPEKLDLVAVNKKLATLSKRLGLKKPA